MGGGSVQVENDLGGLHHEEGEVGTDVVLGVCSWIEDMDPAVG
jgi:hypothetical protein